MSITFGQARETFSQQAEISSAHTLAAYLRAIDLFLGYLDTAEARQNFKLQASNSLVLPVSTLGAESTTLLANFAQWLAATPANPNNGDRRPYAPTTVALRLAGVQNWFEFMAAKDWLAADFSLEAAISQLKTQISTSPQASKLLEGKNCVSWYEH